MAPNWSSNKGLGSNYLPSRRSDCVVCTQSRLEKAAVRVILDPMAGDDSITGVGPPECHRLQRPEAVWKRLLSLRFEAKCTDS